MQPGPSPFRLRKVGPATPPAVDPHEDPRQKLADRERSVTGDHRNTNLLGRHPPERLWPRCHVDDPFRLAEPEREHLLEVGKQLARSPRRLRGMIEPLRE